jgi:hypothetical protein
MVTTTNTARPMRVAALLLLALSCGTRRQEAEVKATVARYDELLRDGYQRQDMSFVREVATEEQTRKLYFHMAALGEGRLRLNAALKALEFVAVKMLAPRVARVETREVWDYTHYEIATGKKYAEERGFVYRMAYELRRPLEGRWVVSGAEVISAEAGETVIPWPKDLRGPVEARGPAAAGGTR